MKDGFEISVEDLKERLARGDDLFFINLHHHHHRDWSIMKARGALPLDDNEVEEHLDEIPRDKPVVVYATCTGDEASFKVARLLQSHGWSEVHPLVGGFNAYVEAGLPVERIGEGTPARDTMML